MICTHCNKENRAVARYCKWCGAPIVHTEDLLDNIVGLEDLKEQVKSVVATLIHLKSHSQTQNIQLNLNTILIGETGTGKTTIPHILKDYLVQHNILSSPKLKVVDAVDYHRFVEKWDSNVKEIKGGILFFDNVQKLLPDSYSKNVNPLDKLFIEMDRWNNDPIVFIAGLPGGFEEFLENNPAVRNRFRYLFRLPTFTADEIYELCIRTLQERYSIKGLSATASEKLKRQIKHEVKTRDESFGNAHHARQKAEDIFTAYLSHPPLVTSEIQEEDIIGYVPSVRTLNDILSDLDDFVGMESVKHAIREIAWEVENAMQRLQRGLGDGEKPSVHIVLTGNPGTGKTTIARKLGEILEAIGFLENSHVEEVDRSRMVSQYVGETPKLVDHLCDKAMGGILFIDEAYTLAPINNAGVKDEQGLQALEKLMKRMEDDRGKFVVIAAGYKTEIENLLRVNPGMRSRFNRFLHIDDYTSDELYRILMTFATKKHYRFDKDASEIARLAVIQIYENRSKNFANAREMRTLFERICTRQAERINRLPYDKQTDDTLLTIIAEDIPYDKPVSVDYTTCLKGLDNLVGLESVKEEVIRLASYINLQIQRGDASSIIPDHYVFTGNPGTGKTTVARIMADILKALGVISRGQLIEVDRSHLVAGFAGQTAIKTNQVVDSALGGVLFIDEAYMLCSGENDNFGKEALDTLLKRLEDDRGKFVCIVAGYTHEMHTFIHSNPGLKSRFSKTIHFEDYKPAELTSIFCNLAAKNNFVLSDEIHSALLHHFERIHAMRDVGFGNAREARKLFDQAVSRQSTRLMNIMGTSSFNQGMMSCLTKEDIIESEEKKVKTLDEVMTELDEFIGMDSIKESVRRLAVQIVFMQQRLSMGIGSAEPMTLNMIITGNPGTGKTSIARKMGEVFKAVGLLPSDKVIEAGRNQMVGKFMGETTRLVNELCERAMGGVLFIDEAYTLYDTESHGGDQYGKEAVSALAKRMEDDRGKFVVIAVGYRKEMEAFLRSAPGLESRFTHKLNIEDYNEFELVSIFKAMAAKKQYMLTEAAESILMERVHNLYIHKDRGFGNAREIRRLFDAAVRQLSMRVASKPTSELTDNDYKLIEAQDMMN